MYQQIGLDRVQYDFSYLPVSSHTSPLPVGNWVDTSGVKSGLLVVQVGDVAVPTGAHIFVKVVPAIRQPDGSLVMADPGSRNIAELDLDAGISGTELIQIAFSAIPGPGVVVLTYAVTGSSTGTLKATLTIGLELLPT